VGRKRKTKIKCKIKRDHATGAFCCICIIDQRKASLNRYLSSLLERSPMVGTKIIGLIMMHWRVWQDLWLSSEVTNLDFPKLMGVALL
jgi:hypothetical protein